MSTTERSQQGNNQPRALDKERRNKPQSAQTLDDSHLDSRVKQPSDEDEHLVDEEQEVGTEPDAGSA